MKSLNKYIKEALEPKTIDNLTATYKCTKDYILIDCPETYQEDDVRQYLDDKLLPQMPSNPQIAEKCFHVNVKYINDAYFEYKSFERLSYKSDNTDITYDRNLGKDVSEDVKIVTFKLSYLKFKILFSKFELMVTDENIDTTLDTIFKAYSSNAYNETTVKFKYSSCEYDQ